MTAHESLFNFHKMFQYMCYHNNSSYMYYIQIFTGIFLSDCNLSLPENKLVSGHHCHILQEEDGQVFLCDTR